jgi:hypothetical protein
MNAALPNSRMFYGWFVLAAAFSGIVDAAYTSVEFGASIGLSRSAYWRARRDSNARPLASEANTLSN